jgi:hypothetical protein
MPSADETTLNLLVNGKHYPLLEVGSGFAHFVMVLAAAARRRPTYILIDEPELSLHASLQADFLDTLTAYASEGVLYATHSLGLARASADRIYSIVSDGSQSRVQPYNQTPSLAEFVGGLSFGRTPDLGFDRVLLVESPSDGRALQQLLRLHHKEHQILMLPLGGSTLIKGGADAEAQLLELKRITPNISALVDSERAVADDPLDANRSGFAATCGKLTIPCHIMGRRALENYFPTHAIESEIGPGRVALGHFDRLSDARPGWPKSLNWKIARAMSLDDLNGTDLGAFLALL